MISFEDRELAAVVALFKGASKEQKAGIRKGLRKFEPLIQGKLRSFAKTPEQQAMANSASFSATNKGVRLKVGSRGTWGNSPGAKLSVLVRPYEFGGYPQRYVQYLSRRGGNGFRVDRRTQRQLPKRNTSGWFVYPSVAESVPELTSAWLGYTVDVYRERFG